MQKNIITAVALVAVVGLSGCGSSERAGQVADAAKIQMVEVAENQLQPEDYHWPRCEEEDQLSCVWVAEEQGTGENFLALSDGDVVPLNYEQALAMVGDL